MAIENYETYTKTYRQLCDGKLQKPVYDALAKVMRQQWIWQNR